MDRFSLKRRLLGNRFIYKLIKYYFEFKYLFYNRIIVSRGNKIKINSSVIRKKVRITVNGKNNEVIIHRGCRLTNLTIEVNGTDNRIFFDQNVHFYEKGHILIEGNSCSVNIGTESTFNETKLYLSETGNAIIIGNNCMFSIETVVSTTDFHPIYDIQTNERLNPAESIKIGNKVWIGNGAYITKGAVVSDNSIVSARAFVNKKFSEQNVIIGGIPAKILKKGVCWTR